MSNGSTPNDDFFNLAVDIIKLVTENPKVDTLLAKKVSERLQWGPQITIWPKDAAEASQRARDRARLANPPVLPRKPVLPILPTLPRTPTLPTLPRTPTLPTLPRKPVLPTLPRTK